MDRPVEGMDFRDVSFEDRISNAERAVSELLVFVHKPLSCASWSFEPSCEPVRRISCEYIYLPKFSVLWGRMCDTNFVLSLSTYEPDCAPP